MSGQGQGLSTIDKERQIAAMLDMNMQIVRKSCPGLMYRHFDLNAGSGWNDEFAVPGTPLVFVELAEKYLRNWEATFFEIDEERASQLVARLRGIPRCRVAALDNRVFLTQARNQISRWDIGSVLADPNGWLYRQATNGTGCPVGEMIEFFESYPRIDLIANLNLRHYKQMRGAERCHPHPPAYQHLHGLSDLPRLFNKRHGLISQRSHNGHSQFVRIILRNLRTNDYRAWGWHHLTSPTALEIYRYAETTAAERNGQASFDMGDPDDSTN
jgi:hypothetical protein